MAKLLDPTMAKLLTLLWPKNGQVIDPLYIYIYIYIYEPVGLFAAAIFSLFLERKSFTCLTFLQLRAFLGPKRPTDLTFNPKWTNRKAWDCSPNHFFWKKAWDCNLKPILGYFDWPGANRDGANLQHLFLAMFCYKAGGKTIKMAKCAVANGPTAI